MRFSISLSKLPRVQRELITRIISDVPTASRLPLLSLLVHIGFDGQRFKNQNLINYIADESNEDDSYRITITDKKFLELLSQTEKKKKRHVVYLSLLSGVQIAYAYAQHWHYAYDQKNYILIGKIEADIFMYGLMACVERFAKNIDFDLDVYLQSLSITKLTKSFPPLVKIEQIIQKVVDTNDQKNQGNKTVTEKPKPKPIQHEKPKPTLKNSSDEKTNSNLSTKDIQQKRTTTSQVDGMDNKKPVHKHSSPSKLAGLRIDVAGN